MYYIELSNIIKSYNQSYQIIRYRTYKNVSLKLTSVLHYNVIMTQSVISEEYIITVVFCASLNSQMTHCVYQETWLFYQSLSIYMNHIFKNLI